MRFRLLVCMVLAAVSLGCIVAGAHGFEPTRKETVLIWDDGSMDDPSDYWLGYDFDRVAVMFEMPEWATSVSAVQAYMRCDCQWGGTRADGDAYVYVWAPDEPGSNRPGPVVHGSHHALADTVWSWFTFPLSPPAGIDHPHFHGERRFFVGISWGLYASTGLAFDATAPCSGASWLMTQWNPDWQNTQVDAMVRAVVSDEHVNPVSPTSWTRVKAFFW